MSTLAGKEINLITLRDMSQMLELERQKGINKLKTLVFAQAAHEFRNPLNGIISSLDLIYSYVNHSEGGAYYKIAKNCSNIMLSLVNDILDLA